MVTRPGHSLPELLVTLAFLGTVLGAVAAATLGAVRSTAESVRRQEAFSVAAETLDSLLAGAPPGSGRGTARGLRIEWDAAAAGGAQGVRVRALDAASGEELAALDGVWIAVPPVAGPARP